jgi:hypothetical protein
MPLITIRTNSTSKGHSEEVISEYMCDSPDCPNIAVQVIGIARQINGLLALCEEHAELLAGDA